jgi:hypothetical protein
MVEGRRGPTARRSVPGHEPPRHPDLEDRWAGRGVGPRAPVRITVLGLPSSEWHYRFEPTADGCRVTETWEDQRGPVVRLLGRLATGVDHDAAYTRDGMERTLEQLKTVAEAG